MNSCEEKYMQNLLVKAIDMAENLQPWPNYFESKTRELRIISNFYKFDNITSILEIGCGNGFTASLLSQKAKQVMAFDLPEKSERSHSIGINRAEQLVNMLGIKNINVISGSVEELPFSNAYFDLIFSEYMLHYVKNKNKALTEICRVLKPTGTVITIVPNFVERLALPIIKFEYIFKRLLFHLVNFNKKKESHKNKPFTQHTYDKKSIDLIKSLDNWFFLRPDGAYKSYREEVSRHTAVSWKALFESNGFRVIRTFSTEIIPLGIFDILGPTFNKFISRKTYYLNNILGNLPIIKYMGCSLGLVTVKA